MKERRRLKEELEMKEKEITKIKFSLDTKEREREKEIIQDRIKFHFEMKRNLINAKRDALKDRRISK